MEKSTAVQAAVNRYRYILITDILIAQFLCVFPLIK